MRATLEQSGELGIDLFSQVPNRRDTVLAIFLSNALESDANR
jgi:hypothetical protein